MDFWPGHCAIVVAQAAGTLSAVGGNDNDAVTMDRVTVAADGSLQSQDSPTAAPTVWPIAIEVLYDAESDPDPGADQ